MKAAVLTAPGRIETADPRGRPSSTPCPTATPTHDRAVTEATATGSAQRIDDETEGILPQSRTE
ncbi:hypothetical protein ABZ458_43380, partial [Streptomyces sp. NPDC005760]